MYNYFQQSVAILIFSKKIPTLVIALENFEKKKYEYMLKIARVWWIANNIR